jgi:hypothetical protein
MLAHCNRHDPPQANCVCGIYAWNDLPRDFALPRRGIVWGVVKLSGRALIHLGTGLRAERAEIIALADTPQIGQEPQALQRTARRYDVPLVESSMLVTIAAEHG